MVREAGKKGMEFIKIAVRRREERKWSGWSWMIEKLFNLP